MASTELLQPEQHALMAPASYPVDAITDAENCHLMAEWQNFKVKAAVGSVLPPEPGATYHCRPIPEGYARVMVDEITRDLRTSGLTTLPVKGRLGWALL